MPIGCIIQARTASTRLPDKVNADIGGWPMWRHVFERTKEFGPIMAWALDYPELNENDVLGRYALCARRNGLDAIMRVTGDCPLIAPEACRRVFERFLVGGYHLCGGYDYVANDLVQTYPDGLGCEIMTREVLEYAHRHADKAYDREHVTPFIRRSKDFMKFNVRCPVVGISDLKLSVDTAEDLDFVRKIDAELRPGPDKYSLESTLGAIERVKENGCHG
jgi:spore coat polysaccharide biosynthesis protein SpsF (cytidylyltransferase family)